jgi:hypothetical protein
MYTADFWLTLMNRSVRMLPQLWHLPRWKSVCSISWRKTKVGRLGG